MPTITLPQRLPRRLGALVLATFAAAFLAGALPALAAAACPTGSLSQPFARFGDSASYQLLSGGSFESGTAGWSLNGAAVTAGNESYQVAGGSHSLAIAATGAATSPSFCVDTSEPSFRFFAKRTSGSWGVLNVVLIWKEAGGATHETEVSALQSGTAWTVTPVLQLAGALPLGQAGETLSVKIAFRPEQYGGAWAIDDVYIDPYSR
jgi:hypothetical protein